MTLRIADLEDASSLAALSLEVLLGTYLKRGINSVFADFALDRFTPEKLRMLIASPDEHILVSQNEEGIDGYIRITMNSPSPVKGCSHTEISTFYVQSRHKNKGIGKRLLSAALAYCREQSLTSIWLATNAENQDAIAFYLRQGFVHVGETEFRIYDQGYLNNVYHLELDPV